MADAYAKRPAVTRFGLKKTYGGRDVKRTTVVRRDLQSRKMRQMRPMRKGR